MQGHGRAHGAPWEVSLHEDVARREAHHIYSERLHARRQRRWVEGNTELACSQLTNVERPLRYTLASTDWNIMHPLRVSLKERKGKVAYVPLAPIEFPHFFPSLFL
jgi:hypothetical protein